MPLIDVDHLTTSLTFDDLDWIDALQAEVQEIFNRMIQAGKQLKARNAPVLNALGEADPSL